MLGVKHILTVLILVALICSQAYGAETTKMQQTGEVNSDQLPQCLDLIKECFVLSPVQKNNCFFSAATHAFCEGSPVGKLVFKRWSMAPERPADNEKARFSYGMKIIDQSCLENFDNRLSSFLLEGNLSDKVIEDLRESLSKCEKDLANPLVRP